jgi:hypothetical protein
MGALRAEWPALSADEANAVEERFRERPSSITSFRIQLRKLRSMDAHSSFFNQSVGYLDKLIGIVFFCGLNLGALLWGAATISLISISSAPLVKMAG